MDSEGVQVLPPTPGMVTPHQFPTPLGTLPFFQVTIVKVVISNSWAAITERPFLSGKPLVSIAVWTLRCVHEERKRFCSEESSFTMISALPHCFVESFQWAKIWDPYHPGQDFVPVPKGGSRVILLDKASITCRNYEGAVTGPGGRNSEQNMAGGCSARGVSRKAEQD